MAKSREKLDPNLYTKSGKLRKRKPKKPRTYFSEEADDAIVQYLASDDEAFRNKIYNEKIADSFFKLAENIINNFKFDYALHEADHINDLIHEVVTFLLEKLHNYKKERGKGFSYFGTVAKRYLITKNKEIYESLVAKGTLEEVDEDKTIYNNIINESADKDLIEFVDKFTQYLEVHMDDIFDKSIDKNTGNAILELCKRRENLEVMNKQAFYLYVKEMTSNTAPHITRAVKQLKLLYIELMNEWYLTGDIKI